MIERADFVERIAKALYSVKMRRYGGNHVTSRAEADAEAAQIADRLPVLFRTDEIEL